VAAGRAPGAQPRAARAAGAGAGAAAVAIAVPLFDAATLSHRWPVAKPQPGDFLRRGAGAARSSLPGVSPFATPLASPRGSPLASPRSPRAPASAPSSPSSPPAPPRAGGWARRDNPPDSTFRMLYERGDIPASVDHGGVSALRWRVDLAAIHAEDLLPVFFDGIRETEDPYRFLAVRGAEELIAAAGAAAGDVLPQLIPPLRRALVTRDRAVVATAALLLQALLRAAPAAGRRLQPYYRQLLPTLRLYARGGTVARDGHDYGQRVRGPRNLAAIVDETLCLMHRTGGPHALAGITHIVPTFQAYDN
jgi:hypothetical protein